MSLRPAVFLDRDGTLNEVVMRAGVVSSPRSPQEFRLLAGALDFIVRIQALGFFTAIVTNQPDLARGWLEEKDLHVMHGSFQVDRIEYCASGDNSDRRRKPNPGMLLDLAAECGLDLARSWMIGDSKRDVLAGRAAGVRTIFLAREHNTAERGLADFDCATYAEALEILRG